MKTTDTSTDTDASRKVEDTLKVHVSVLERLLKNLVNLIMFQVLVIFFNTNHLGSKIYPETTKLHSYN